MVCPPAGLCCKGPRTQPSACFSFSILRCFWNSPSTRHEAQSLPREPKRAVVPMHLPMQLPMQPAVSAMNHCGLPLAVSEWSLNRMLRCIKHAHHGESVNNLGWCVSERTWWIMRGGVGPRITRSQLVIHRIRAQPPTLLPCCRDPPLPGDFDPDFELNALVSTPYLSWVVLW